LGSSSHGGVIACDGPTPGTPNGQFANLTTYRDRLSKLVARLDEFDYLFPGHFMVNLENNVLVAIVQTLDRILAKPTAITTSPGRSAEGTV